MVDKFLQKIEKTSVLYLSTILFFAVFFVYANTMSNQLFYDDEDFIYRNEYVKTFNIPKFFSENLIEGAGKVSNYYRPLLAASFALEYRLFGNSPFIYHFTNVVLQAIASVALFFLFFKLFGQKLFAFTTSLLFGIHPIHTEAVAYASGRSDPLSFLFILLTIYFSLSSNSKHLFYSLIFFIFSLLLREIAIVTPFLIIIAHVVHKKSLSKKIIIESFKITIPYFIILGVYAFLRLTLLNFANTLNFYNNQNIYTQNLFIRLNTFLNILPMYLSLLIAPVLLIYDRTPVVYANVTIISIVVFVLIIAIAIIAIKYFKQFPILFFSFFWFLMSFIPTSGLIPINGIFYEHFLYFPSVGFFALFSFFIIFILKIASKHLKIVLLTIFSLYLLFLTGRTMLRNNDWHNPITFYTKTLKYTESARLHNNLAMAYAEERQYKKAIAEYQKAIKLYDIYPQSHYNLANAYLAIGDIGKADDEYKKSIIIDKSFYLSYLKLFEIYKAKDNQEGLAWVLQNIEDLVKSNKAFEPLLLKLKGAR